MIFMKMKNKIKIEQKGFSLIELLVVMVILGILSGIGIAQFKSQQKKAKHAKIIAEKSQSCKLSVASCVESATDNECMTFAECMDTYPVNLVGSEYISFPVPLANLRKITFDFESKGTNTLLFFEDRPYTNRHFITAASNGVIYHNGVANSGGGIQIKVDGEVVTNLNPFKNDGISHAYEVTGFDISHWTSLMFSGYDYSNANVVGVLSNIVFYDDVGGVIARYNFQDQSGLMATDVSGNGHDASIHRLVSESVFWGTD